MMRFKIIFRHDHAVVNISNMDNLVYIIETNSDRKRTELNWSQYLVIHYCEISTAITIISYYHKTVCH